MINIFKKSFLVLLSIILASCGGNTTHRLDMPSTPISNKIKTPTIKQNKENINIEILNPPLSFPISEQNNKKQYKTLKLKNNSLDNEFEAKTLSTEYLNKTILNDIYHDENNIKIISVIDSGFNNEIYEHNIRASKISKQNNLFKHGIYVTNTIYENIKQSTKEYNKNNTNKPIIWTADTSNEQGGLSISSVDFENMYNRGARIFNNSWGTKHSENITYNIAELGRLINNKPETDSIFIFAAGNDNGLPHPTPEASYPIKNDNARNGFIAVAAHAIHNTSKLANYSNKFDEKSKKWGIVSDGTYEYIEQNNNIYSKGVVFGTSFAAPKVSAAVENIWNQFPWMSNHLVTLTILSTADIPGTSEPTKGPDSGYDKPNSNPIFGWGILNKERALKGPALIHKDLLTNKDLQITEENKKPINLLVVDFNHRDYDDISKLTWSNDIKGDGGISKNGTGTLYLSGNNQYSDYTLVRNGAIVLQNKLQNSNVVIEKQGTFKTYNNEKFVEVGQSIKNYGGSLNIYGKGLYVKGNYSGENSSRIVIDIDKSTLKSDGYIDFGNDGYILADIENLETIPEIKNIKTRTIIKTNNGILNFKNQNTKISNRISNFINIYDIGTENNSNKAIQVKYSRKNANIVVSSLGYKNDNIAFNTAKNIDIVFDDLAKMDNKTSDIYKTSLSILSAPNQTLIKTINTLSGEIYASSQNILTNQNEIINKTLSNRISSLLYERKSGFWFNQINNDLKINNKGYANLNSNTKGFLFGLDSKSNNHTLGISALSTHSKAIFNKNAGNIDIKNFGFNIYGSYKFDKFYILNKLGFNNAKNEVKREIIDTNSNISYTSKIYNLYTEIGKIFALNKFNINPYIANKYDWLIRNKISEKAIFGLQANKKMYISNSFLAGIRANFNLKKLWINSNFVYDYKPLPNDFKFNANFTGSNKKINIIGTKESSNKIWAGADIGYNLSKNIMFNLGLELSYDNLKNNNKVFNIGGLYRF